MPTSTTQRPPLFPAAWHRHGRRAALCGIAGLLAVAPASAMTGPGGDDAGTCNRHGSTVEQALKLPDGLLRAIGRVESGRVDPITGTTAPWPWTINANGQGQYFADRAAAVAAVRTLQAGGVRSIDTGCFQVNLQHHPFAFATVEDAFDPALNAAYAGAYLQSLHARLGSWEAAVAAYHSATPERGEAYRARVYAAWNGQPAQTVARRASGPVVIRISGPDLSGPEAPVRVCTPSAPGNAAGRIAMPRSIAIPAALQARVGDR